jgi:hypothetical protein
MHIYDTLKAENWSELNNLTDYVNKKIADFEKAIKAEAERFGQPEYADEDFCYNCWKDCISKNMQFGASIALSFYARMFGIRLLKDMIGQPCYTERDKEICDYYQDKEHMDFHEFKDYRFRNKLVWENLTKIDIDFDIPQSHKYRKTNTYGTFFLYAKTYFDTLCSMGAATHFGTFQNRNLYNWKIKPWEKLMYHEPGENRMKDYRATPSGREALLKDKQRFLDSHLCVRTKTGAQVYAKKELVIRIPNPNLRQSKRHPFKNILKSEATPEELAMAIKE